MRPITGLILGSSLIPLGLVLSLVWVPSTITDANRYDSAPACAEPKPNAAGCWSEIPAVVTKTEVISGKYTSRHYVDLRDAFGTQEVGVLRTVNHPGENMSLTLVAVAGVLIFGVVFFLGALGVHRYEGSWTVHVSGSEYDEHQFDFVAPPARRWIEGGGFILIAALIGGVLSNGYFALPTVPGTLVSGGLAALAWSWWLRRRARKAKKRGKRR